jgi:hypothetical protein
MSGIDVNNVRHPETMLLLLLRRVRLRYCRVLTHAKFVTGRLA